MGRPGKLNLRDAVKGSGGQISLDNYIASEMAGELAEKLKAKGSKSGKKKPPIFDEKGHITLESISGRREFFLNKSLARLEYELKKHGYITRRRFSRKQDSRARIIIILNPSKERNIAQIQVSPGSKRHGEVPYVKISTKDIGKIKIINSTIDKYKSDGHERAVLLYRRY
jgi:hypothetical protein